MFKPLLLLLFSCATLLVHSQKLEKSLQELDANYSQEKIHLFLNKEAFVAGETIYFKAYVFSGYVLSNISANLYVELYNDYQQVVDKLLVPLINGTGQGTISLSSKYPEGQYHIRAYTRWMQNFDNRFQYFYSIPIYNQASARKLSPKPVQWKAAAYPESGTLLAGEDNKVAIRLQSSGSLPASFSGYVAEATQPAKKLASFQSFNQQLAAFSFFPEKGKHYLVMVEDGNGRKDTLSLQPEEKGVLLKAARMNDRVFVDMLFKGFAEGGMNCKLVGIMQDQVVYSAISRRKDELVRTSIPITKLREGILVLALFDAAENLLAERLVFIHDQPQGNMVTAPDFSGSARSLNYISVSQDTSYYFTYAASVTDDISGRERSRSILSDLYLGDLPPGIHQPHWYFAGDRTEAMDALMVTEKWSRFNWNDLLQEKFPALEHKPEKYLSFRGMATRKGRPVPLENMSLTIRFKDSSMQFVQVKTDAKGEFLIEEVAFYDTVKVFYQVNKQKNQGDVELRFFQLHQFQPFKGNFPASSFIMTERKAGDTIPKMVMQVQNHMKNQVKLDNQYTKLEEVRVQAKAKSAKEKLNEKLASPLFQTDRETVFDFVNEDHNLVAYTNIFDWLEGRVPGLSFRVLTEAEAQASTIPMVAGQRVPVMRDGTVALFLDEIEVDLSTISSLNTSDIAMVKVIRGYNLASMGAGGGGGAIAIYTRKGEDRNRFGNPAIPSLVLAGYTTPLAFKPMDFGEEFVRSIQNDTREQLFWGPGLAPGNNGKAEIRFYNNDQPQGWRIVVTGVTSDMKPVFMELVRSN